METTTHPLTLTVEQAAKVLGISRSTAYELVHTGDIPSLRLGRRIVVPTAKIATRLGLDASDISSASTIRPLTAPATQRAPRRTRTTGPSVESGHTQSLF